MSETKGFFFKADTFELVADADVNKEDPQLVEIVSKEQLVPMFSKEDLLRLRRSVFGSNTAIDEKKTVATLAEEIWNEIHREDPQDEEESKAKSKGKNKKETKTGRLRKILAEKGTMGREDLAQQVGVSYRDIHVMVSIMRNEKRTKDPVDISYDKEAKTYTWPV